VTMEESGNIYAQLLREQGKYVITVEGVDWYEYQGFMVSAYLPHCCPVIRRELADKVLRISGKPFVRWDSGFGQVKNGQWWYVVRKEPWSLEQCSGNTRSKIRRGRKRLFARVITPEEVLKWGYEVCRKAATRYEKSGFVPPRDVYEKKIQAVGHVGGVLEFFGVFFDKQLVGYSENYIQNNAAFWESIWYHPEFLPKYSSYVLLDEMLNYYLNNRKLLYVSDGSRSIYHKTQVQDFLIKVFGFTKVYAVLNVAYSTKFAIGMHMAYPFKRLVWHLCGHYTNSTLHKVGAVLKQEYIKRACKKVKVVVG